jgi:hypothetical protein
LVSPTYFWRSVVVWTLWTAAYFVANGLNNWMPTLYKTVYELDLQSSLRAASMTNVASNLRKSLGLRFQARFPDVLIGSTLSLGGS